MRAINIKVGDMTSFQVKDMRINHCPNEHVALALEGYISEIEVEKVQRLALEDEVVQVSAIEDGFAWKCFGLIYDIELQHLLHEKYLKLTLISQSVKMDQERKTRSFQNNGTMISEIIEYVCKDYNAVVTINGTDKKMDEMVVQYQETDWEFIKRLASQMNQQIIVHSNYAGLVFDVGLASKGSMASDGIMMPIFRKDIQALRRELDYELSEAEVEIIIFESRVL